MSTSPSRRAAAKSLALAAAAAANAKYKAVFAVSEADPARWNLVLGNLRNAQADIRS